MPDTKATTWITILVAALISFSSSARSASCPPPARPSRALLQRLAARDHPDRGFLWQLTRNGQQSFLYGTVHVARLEWDFPGPLTRRSLEQASALAVEVDVSSPTLAQRMRKAAPLQDTAIPPEFLAALQRDIDEQARAACVDPERLKGSSLSSQLESLALLSGRNAGLYPDYAIEAALAGFVRVKRKPVVELETPDEQAVALEDIAGLQRNLARLVAGQAERTLKKLAFAWAAGDRATLEHIEDWCECSDPVAERAALARMVNDRNAALSRRIDSFYRTHPNGFAAIGVLHVVGSDSVIARLQREGYEVHALWPAATP